MSKGKVAEIIVGGIGFFITAGALGQDQNLLVPDKQMELLINLKLACGVLLMIDSRLWYKLLIRTEQIRNFKKIRNKRYKAAFRRYLYGGEENERNRMAG